MGQYLWERREELRDEPRDEKLAAISALYREKGDVTEAEVFKHLRKKHNEQEERKHKKDLEQDMNSVNVVSSGLRSSRKRTYESENGHGNEVGRKKQRMMYRKQDAGAVEPNQHHLEDKRGKARPAQLARFRYQQHAIEMEVLKFVKQEEEERM